MAFKCRLVWHYVTGALHAELAELYTRAKEFPSALSHADSAVQKLRAQAAAGIRGGGTAAAAAADSPGSIRAMGTKAFITARGGDLTGAAALYRDAIKSAVEGRVFKMGSIELADLEAALGSTCYAASDRGGGGGGGGDKKGAAAAVVCSRAAQKLLEESLGCFGRAAEVTRRLQGSRSMRYKELAQRVEEVAAALDVELRSGGGVDTRRAL